MITDKNPIKLLAQNVITSGTFEKYDIEVRRKIILLNIMCIIAIINLIPLGIVAFIQDYPILGFFDLIVALVLIIIVTYLRKSGYNDFVSYFGVFVAGVLFLYLFITGGVNNTGHLWSYSFPVFALFLLGSKRGAIATLMLFVPSLLLLIIGSYPPITAIYTTDFKIRFIPSFLVVFGFSYFFEKLRERTQQLLAQKNAELEETISNLKQAQKALRQSEEKYRNLFDTAMVGMYRTAIEDGKVIEANVAFAKIFGYETVEELKKEFATSKSYVNPERREELIELLKMRGSVDRFEIEEFRKDGTCVFVEVSGTLHPDQGYIEGFIVDNTERKHAEKERKHLEDQLQRAKKLEAIGTLAGGVAHDLNNILGGLVSYPELLLMQMPEDSPLRKSILTIQKSGEKAAAVVQDLLTLARRGVVVTEVVNLNDVVAEYLKSPEHENLQSYHPGVHLETYLATDTLNILGSSTHLSKTVMNLISNAAEAMPEGGKLTISTENRYIDRPIRGYDNVKEGDYVVLTVSDTGTGISPDDMDKIFEPFYTKKKMGRSGTGLGMAVVWGTVKDHKGYIHVESTEGRGTTFTLYFPVTRKSVEDRSEIFLEDYMGKGEAILIVDDVEEQRQIASGMLKELGYSVVSVSSGEEAVEYLKTNKADLLVLDMIMDPGMDGLETYRKIIEIHPGQKAIIASGFSETDRVKEVQDLGAGTYIRKPLLLEKIGIAVKEELEK